jgi:hypothetical protein
MTHIAIRAGGAELILDAAGRMLSLTPADGRDRLAAGRSAALVSLVIDGQSVAPTSVDWASHEPEPSMLRFTNAHVGYEVQVRVIRHVLYTRLEVVACNVPAEVDVQALLWGPIGTSIADVVGESVGIVRDADIAVGMKVLNDRTEGGWALEHEHLGWAAEVVPRGLQIDDQEGWFTAARTPWGSLLRAHTWEYTRPRTRRVRFNAAATPYEAVIGPLPDGGLVGSALALFGVPPDMVLTALAVIAADAGLPYPTIAGQWQKVSPLTGKSWMVFPDLAPDTVGEAAGLTREAGLDVMYSFPPSLDGGPWRSTGHYVWSARFGGDDTSAARLVKAAGARGVGVGTHTLSSFVHADDPYLSPSPHSDLATAGAAILAAELEADATTVHLHHDCGAPDALQPGVVGRTLRIDDEFISWTTAIPQRDGWRLEGVARGRWRSVPTHHAAGATVTRVVENEYAGALAGLPLIDKIAVRLAEIREKVGTSAMSYDGLEGAAFTGWGAYGMARLVNGSHAESATRDGFIVETSRMPSNCWDAISRASWGEIDRSSWEQLLINNSFYLDNYLPPMLGWIALKGFLPVVAFHTTLARLVALNSGAGFSASLDSLAAGRHSNTGQLLDAIRQWEDLRGNQALSDEQRAALLVPGSRWLLTTLEPGYQWRLHRLDQDDIEVGEPWQLRRPEPALLPERLPDARTGSLYGVALTSTLPVIRWEITNNELPDGLRLHADTGGLVGVPTRPGSWNPGIRAIRPDGGTIECRYRLDVRM